MQPVTLLRASPGTTHTPAENAHPQTTGLFQDSYAAPFPPAQTLWPREDAGQMQVVLNYLSTEFAVNTPATHTQRCRQPATSAANAFYIDLSSPYSIASRLSRMAVSPASAAHPEDPDCIRASFRVSPLPKRRLPPCTASGQGSSPAPSRLHYAQIPDAKDQSRPANLRIVPAAFPDSTAQSGFADQASKPAQSSLWPAYNLRALHSLRRAR